MLMDHTHSTVFGSSDVKLESALKNPNQYRNAVLFEALSSMPTSKIKEFVNSKEAKVMIEEGLISYDVLERLVEKDENGLLKTTVCHMAKEEGDPVWDELVKHRMEERRLMNELLEKYYEKAKRVADNVNKDFVEACIPAYFRENK